MAKNQNGQKPEHLGTFWPLVVVFVIAALLGGIIIGVAYGNMIQDNIYSLNFKASGAGQHSQSSPASIKKSGAKSSVEK